MHSLYIHTNEHTKVNILIGIIIIVCMKLMVHYVFMKHTINTNYLLSVTNTPSFKNVLNINNCYILQSTYDLWCISIICIIIHTYYICNYMADKL